MAALLILRDARIRYLHRVRTAQMLGILCIGYAFPCPECWPSVRLHSLEMRLLKGRWVYDQIL